MLYLVVSNTPFRLAGDTIDLAERMMSDYSLPLNAAAREGDADRVARMISSGEDIEAKDGIAGRTSLHEAAFSGSADSVRALLDSGASVDSKSRQGSTPLHLAAEHGHLDVVKILIEAGADVDHANHNTVTPLNQAAKSGVASIVKLLVDSGASVDGVHDAGVTPLYAAAWSGHDEAVKVLLSEGADVNGRVAGEHPSVSPLYSAAQRGHVGIMRTLLEEGADPNYLGRVKGTPLHIAAVSGEDEALLLLLEYGVTDVDEENRHRLTALHNAVISKQHSSVSILLEAGADPERKLSDKLGKIRGAQLAFVSKRVARLVPGKLNTDKLSPGIADRRWTSLHFALSPYNGNPEVVAALLDGGADLEARLTHDATVLHLAVDQFNDEARVRRLLEFGSDPNSKDMSGSTPLHYAAFYGYDTTASMLLEHGADANIANLVGKTPLDYTECLGNSSTGGLLIEHGAVQQASVDGEVSMEDLCLTLLGKFTAFEMQLVSWFSPLLVRMFRSIEV